MTTVTPGTGLVTLDGIAPIMPVRPGTGALTIYGVPAQAGTLYNYATIVAGIVTAITFHALSIPTSTLTTLYYDITAYSPTPNVGDYFDEVCQTFSTAPFTIPPGSVAPPFPPGGTPVPPGSGVTPIPPGPPPPPVLIPVLIAFQADPDDDTLVTNMPTGRAEVGTVSRTAFDLTRCYGVRAQTHVDVKGPTNGVLAFEYSADRGASWLPLDTNAGPWVLIETTGDARGQLVGIDPFARADVLLRAVTDQGDGASDPELGNFALMAYMSADTPSVHLTPPGPDLPTGCGIATAWPQFLDWHNAPPLPTNTPNDLEQYIERWGIYPPSLGPENFVIFLGLGWYFEQSDKSKTLTASTSTDILDTSVLWHGHRTYKGAPFFYTAPSDGGVPAVTEDIPAGDQTDMWGRMRVKFDPSFRTSSGAPPSTAELLFFEFYTDGDIAAFGFDTYRDEVRIWSNWDGTLANAQVVGTAFGNVLIDDWIEVGFHYAETAGTFTIDFYLGAPCTSLKKVGTVTGTGNLNTSGIGHFQYYTYTNATHFWLGDIEEYIPESTYPNPFGYS